MAIETTDTEQGGAGSLTEEQRIANIVNSAVSSQLKRALPKMLGEAIDSQLAPLREAQESRRAATGNTGSDVQEPEWKQRMETLERNLKEEKQARAAERRASLEKTAFETLRSELTGKVRPEAVDHAAKLLFHADKAVKVASDGSFSFVLGEDEYDLKDGVSAYLKTPAAALFLAAPGYNDKRKRPVEVAPRRIASEPAPANRRETPLEKTLRELGVQSD